MITEDYVRKIFKGLEQGDGASFFEHVDDKVDWIDECTKHAVHSLENIQVSDLMNTQTDSAGALLGAPGTGRGVTIT